MKTVPDNPPCEICGAPATLHLLDASSDVEHLVCGSHCPDLSPGQNPALEIRRYRPEPNGPVSRRLAAAEDDPDYPWFRREMCEDQILGGEGACRYYLSRLTDTDQFALWNVEFLDNLREYVVAQTNGAAAVFPFDLHSVGLMAPFLKQKYYAGRADSPRQTKLERAVVLLMQHPAWSDEKIAEQVPTTIQQLQRNTSYTALRRSLTRRNSQ